jgi:hypothetical protein
VKEPRDLRRHMRPCLDRIVLVDSGVLAVDPGELH